MECLKCDLQVDELECLSTELLVEDRVVEDLRCDETVPVLVQLEVLQEIPVMSLLIVIQALVACKVTVRR